jgi:hypothetical protein
MSKGAMFRKFHGLSDRQLMAGLGHQAMKTDMHSAVINHNAKVLIYTVVLSVVEAAAIIYLVYLQLWRS